MSKTFKKLLEQQECLHPQLTQDEVWILGCYKSYLQQSMKTNCPERLNYLKGWWKGCLKNYNNKRKIKKENGEKTRRKKTNVFQG